MLFGILLIIGAAGALFLGITAFSGPSAGKAVKRRLELLKERHGEGGVLAASAQAQIRKLMAARQSRAEGLASTLIPSLPCFASGSSRPASRSALPNMA